MDNSKVDAVIVEVVKKGNSTLGAIVDAVNTRAVIQRSGGVTDRFVRGRLQILRKNRVLELKAKRFWWIASTPQAPQPPVATETAGDQPGVGQ